MLRGGPGLREGPAGAELWIRKHRSESDEVIPVDDPGTSGYHGHGGGDFDLIDGLDRQLAQPGTDTWMESHLICFAAEQSRLAGGRTIDLKSFSPGN